MNVPVHYTLFAGQLKLLELWLLQRCSPALAAFLCGAADWQTRGLHHFYGQYAIGVSGGQWGAERESNHLAWSKVHVDSSCVHVVICIWMTIFYIPEFVLYIYTYTYNKYTVYYTHIDTTIKQPKGLKSPDAGRLQVWSWSQLGGRWNSSSLSRAFTKISTKRLRTLGCKQHIDSRSSAPLPICYKSTSEPSIWEKWLNLLACPAWCHSLRTFRPRWIASGYQSSHGCWDWEPLLWIGLQRQAIS